MTLARLVVAALVLASLPASAQVTSKGNRSPGSAFFSDSSAPAATPSEPWRVIPKQSADVHSEGNPLDRIRVDQYEVYDDVSLHDTEPPSYLRGKRHWHPFDRLGEQPETDTACFAIRSYVVARDSKDSDSTHPAGYSTCRPSDRYRVKSAEIRVESGDR